MTYCCGVLVRDGLVMIADTRTNAGLDNVSTFRKLHVFQHPGERIMALASSGNLSISQSVVSMLTEGMENPETGELETLKNAPTMFQAAQRIGHAIRRVHDIEGHALEASDVKFDVSFLFGGQIGDEKLRLFMIYAAGNFIECTIDTPYLQIGEHKYGKPVLDAETTPRCSASAAARAALAVAGTAATSPIWRSRSITWRTTRTKSPAVMSSSSSTSPRSSPAAQAWAMARKVGSGWRVSGSPAASSSACSSLVSASIRW